MGIEKSRLLGGKNKEPSRLLGKSLEKERALEHEELSEENLKGRVVIQRDSGKEFKIVAVHEPTIGSDKRLVANLERVGGTDKVSTGAGRLLELLRTPGSPWRLKE